MEASTQKRLNFLRESPGFVVQEISALGDMEAYRPAGVLRGAGICWVSGVTTLNGGREIESAFRLDTSNVAGVFEAYWWLAGEWVSSRDPRADGMLALAREDIYPFEWASAVPLRENTPMTACLQKAESKLTHLLFQRTSVALAQLPAQAKAWRVVHVTLDVMNQPNDTKAHQVAWEAWADLRDARWVLGNRDGLQWQAILELAEEVCIAISASAADGNV